MINSGDAINYRLTDISTLAKMRCGYGATNQKRQHPILLTGDDFSCFSIPVPHNYKKIKVPRKRSAMSVLRQIDAPRSGDKTLRVRVEESVLRNETKG